MTNSLPNIVITVEVPALNFKKYCSFCIDDGLEEATLRKGLEFFLGVSINKLVNLFKETKEDASRG